MTVLLVALGAALGAPLRYAWAHTLDGRWPSGTLLANTVASGLVGFFGVLSLSDAGWALLATGFCGALSSFSAFAVQAVERPPRRAASYVAATALLALGACTLGWTAGSLAVS